LHNVRQTGQGKWLVFESFDESLLALGGVARKRIIEELQEAGIQYGPKSFDLRRSYNHLKLRLGPTFSNVIIGLAYQKFCAKLGIPQETIPRAIENYERLQALLARVHPDPTAH
jgi:hypothetical protein